MWLGGGLLSGVVFLVLFHELRLIDWQQQGPADVHFTLSALLAGVTLIAIGLGTGRLSRRVTHQGFSR